ncbi:MAG: FAD:protein FMN transferase [Verrucomicrobiales bacterium]|nr:FAD:protein FMN transferase [Verrucomicrobiales bacterium]
MATRFEFVIHGERESALRAAGEEAVAEIHRIEAELSVFRPDSQIARLNREAGQSPVRLSPEIFDLLHHATQLSQATGGAFDVTVGPLLQAWGLRDSQGRLPSAEEIAQAHECVGAHRIRFDPENRLVQFHRPGVALDLGGIGKGYALDRAAELLREAGVSSALLHGGTSTVVAIGNPPDAEAWKVAIDRPAPMIRPPNAPEAPPTPTVPLAIVALRDESLSVSAVWGRGFEINGIFYGHVMDPRIGRPVTGAWLAALVLPSATESDALSTALLVDGKTFQESLRRHLPQARSLIVQPASFPPGFEVFSNGISAST